MEWQNILQIRSQETQITEVLIKKATSQLCESRNCVIFDHYLRCSVRGWDVTCFLPLNGTTIKSYQTLKKASLNINVINSIFRFILSLLPVIPKVQRLKGNFILPPGIFWCKDWLWADFAPDGVPGLWCRHVAPRSYHLPRWMWHRDAILALSHLEAPLQLCKFLHKTSLTGLQSLYTC